MRDTYNEGEGTDRMLENLFDNVMPSNMGTFIQRGTMQSQVSQQDIY